MMSHDLRIEGTVGFEAMAKVEKVFEIKEFLFFFLSFFFFFYLITASLKSSAGKVLSVSRLFI